MPKAHMKPCAGCRRAVLMGVRRCERCARRERQQYDRDRGTAAQRGYGHRWRLARATYVREHPLCVPCASAGKVTAAAEVDHIVAHEEIGDAWFWDRENWQSLCKRCHSAKTARENERWG